MHILISTRGHGMFITYLYEGDTLMINYLYEGDTLMINYLYEGVVRLGREGQRGNRRTTSFSCLQSGCVGRGA